LVTASIREDVNRLSSEDFTAYVEGAWARMFRTAYALTGDQATAEDLLQRTLVKAFVQWKRVSHAESPDSYVRRMLVNESASGWRARSRRPEVLTADLPEQPGTTAFDSAFATREELWEGVQTLPPRQRAVVVLRYYEDLSEREIAEVLGISNGTVKSLANAAVAKLRNRLQPVDHLEEQP
jgi:RNA polymerase sigma-70 factor (sigma-E family)